MDQEISINPNEQHRSLMGRLAKAFGPLRILLGISAVILAGAMAIMSGYGPAADVRSISLRSVIPSLSVMVAMVLFFDVLMLTLLRSAHSPDQQRVDVGIIIAWLGLCVILAGLFVILLNAT